MQIDILHALQRRYATKVFDRTKKISGRDWAVLESALVLCPSGYGLQPWKFLVIRQTEIRRKLRTASIGQSQVEDCSNFVVFTSKTSIDEAYIDRHVANVAEFEIAPKKR